MPGNQVRVDFTSDTSKVKQDLKQTGQVAEQTKGEINQLGAAVQKVSTGLKAFVVAELLQTMQTAADALEQGLQRRRERQAARHAALVGSPAEELASLREQAYNQALADQPGIIVDPRQWGRALEDPLGALLKQGTALPVVGGLVSIFQRRKVKADRDRLLRQQLLEMAVQDPIDIEELLTQGGGDQFLDLLPGARRAYAYQFRDVAEERARRRIGRQQVQESMDTAAYRNQININMGIVGDPNAAGRAIRQTTDRRDRNNGRPTTTTRRK